MEQTNRPGDLVGRALGQYRILSQLGDGAQADVYLARDLSLGRYAAVKVFKALRKDVSALLREARMIATLSHRNIIQVYAVDVTASTPYMAMEYAPTVLHQRVRESGRLSLRRSLRFVRQAASALEHAHRRGVIHRDVKPGNMLIGDEGELKLADFGLAAMGEPSGSGLIGTPQFMAPEVWNGLGASEASDIYSLGCCLYFMLTSHAPFSSESYSSLRLGHIEQTIEVPNSVPKPVRELIHEMTAKDPAKRPGDGEALAKELWDLEQVERGDSQNFDTGVGVNPGENIPQQMADALVSAPPFDSTRKELAAALFTGCPLVGLTGEGHSMLPLILNQVVSDHSQQAFVAARIAATRDPLLEQLAELLLLGECERPAAYDAIAQRLGGDRESKTLSILQVGLSHPLRSQGVSDIIELSRRLAGRRTVLLVGAPKAVAEQLTEGFRLGFCDQLENWLEVGRMELSTAWSLVSKLTESASQSPRLAVSAERLLSYMVRDAPENSPRLVHNALALARILELPFVTSFACVAGSAHADFINRKQDIAERWLAEPEQWPDPDTRALLDAIRLEWPAAD